MKMYDLQEEKYILENEILSEIKGKHYSRQDLWIQLKDSIYYFIINQQGSSNPRLDMVEFKMLTKERKIASQQELTNMDVKPEDTT